MHARSVLLYKHCSTPPRLRRRHALVPRHKLLITRKHQLRCKTTTHEVAVWSNTRKKHMSAVSLRLGQRE